MTKYIEWIKGSCELDEEADMRKCEFKLTPAFIDVLDKVVVKKGELKQYLYTCPNLNLAVFKKRYKVRTELTKYCNGLDINGSLGEFFNNELIDSKSDTRILYFKDYNDYVRQIDVIKILIDYCIQALCDMKRTSNVVFRTEVEDEE